MGDSPRTDPSDKYPPIFRFKPGAVKWACILATVAEIELIANYYLAKTQILRGLSDQADATDMLLVCAGWPAAFFLAMGLCYLVGTYNAGMMESGAVPSAPLRLGPLLQTIRYVCPERFRWLIPATPEDTISSALVLWPLLWCCVVAWVDLGAITGLRPMPH